MYLLAFNFYLPYFKESSGRISQGEEQLRGLSTVNRITAPELSSLVSVVP